MDKNVRLSFEFFPPKTAEGMHKLLYQAKKLASVQPNFFSVTFGAGGTTRQGTLEAVQQLHAATQMTIAPHLSCLGIKRADLHDIITHYRALGFNRLVALRGDHLSTEPAVSDLNSACELIQFIRDHHDQHFHIETAAYPECHPKDQTIQADVENLKRKSEAGANSAITQYFFNVDAYYYYLEECAKQKVTLPIVPGIMPIMQFQKLIHFSQLCGAEIPRWLHKRLAAYEGDAASITAFGIEFTTRLCEELLNLGAPGLHFYTLNQADSVLGVVGNL